MWFRRGSLVTTVCISRKTVMWRTPPVCGTVSAVYIYILQPFSISLNSILNLYLCFYYVVILLNWEVQYEFV
jgi:hypothetical protein